jgi:hypothetical protein
MLMMLPYYNLRYLFIHNQEINYEKREKAHVSKLKLNTLLGCINGNIIFDEQDQQGKAAFNERNPHTTQQQEPVARSPGRPNKNRTGH